MLSPLRTGRKDLVNGKPKDRIENRTRDLPTAPPRNSLPPDYTDNTLPTHTNFIKPPTLNSANTPPSYYFPISYVPFYT